MEIGAENANCGRKSPKMEIVGENRQNGANQPKFWKGAKLMQSKKEPTVTTLLGDGVMAI